MFLALVMTGSVYLLFLFSVVRRLLCCYIYVIDGE